MTEILFPKMDMSKYVGQWVVISRKKIIAHNKDLGKITKEIRKCRTAPTVAKIPKKDTLIF